MWIKGRNGTLINMEKVICVFVGTSNNSFKTVKFEYGNNTCTEYNYNSAERCQEIIDEIEFYINNRLGAHKDCFKAIYTMPKE